MHVTSESMLFQLKSSFLSKSDRDFSFSKKGKASFLVSLRSRSVTRSSNFSTSKYNFLQFVSFSSFVLEAIVSHRRWDGSFSFYMIKNLTIKLRGYFFISERSWTHGRECGRNWLHYRDVGHQ